MAQPAVLSFSEVLVGRGPLFFTVTACQAGVPVLKLGAHCVTWQQLVPAGKVPAIVVRLSCLLE